MPYIQLINLLQVMDRLKRKQLEQLKIQKELKLLDHKNALKSIIQSEETIRIVIKYAQQYLRTSNVDTLSEYSPVQISRLVFDKQLKQIEQYFLKLPDHEAYISHFIIIMLKVMKFSFEKSPLYMVGLKDMFFEVAQQGQQTITYHQFFKYILGQLVTMKEEQQNTEFQVRLIERKKQDYLLHDNGIKRIYYSSDLKMMFSLDERSNTIKFYDQDMKNIMKFTPKKDKHQNKYPIILDFDYSVITERLGAVLSDQTLSIVHLTNLIEKSQADFDANPMNEVVFPLPEKMRRIFFVQMMNKWLTCTEEGNKLYLFDMDRIRTQPEKVQSRLRLNLNDQNFTSILEVVQLSCICVVAGNEVNFYNQNFSQVKFKKFVHCEEIHHFKYSDEKNQFYLCGFQKNITVFSINRAGHPSKIWTFPTSKPITSFQIFPYFDTIVVADENNDLKLMHESTRVIYQQLSYGHIVKAKDKYLSLGKISKNEFSVFQTYLIVMTQEKIAIERDIEYSFLPYHYYDEQKEELYVSVNNQIISFSLLSGEIRKNYSIQTSNLQKHHCMFISHRCPLFILDHEFNIFEVYQNDELGDGEYKNYRKKINLESVSNCFYDTKMNTFMAVNNNSISQMRNDKNNNFNTVNSIVFQGFGNIVMSTFCEHTKTVTMLTSDQLVYQLKNFKPEIESCFRFIFPKDPFSHEERLITSLHFDYLYDLFVLFSNKNEVYFIQKTTKNQIYFNIIENMPAKLKHLQFVSCRYQLVREKKNTYEPFVLLCDDSGFLVQFDLKHIFQEHGFRMSSQEVEVRPMFKDMQTVQNEGIEVESIQLSQKNRLKNTYEGIGLLKAHEKHIVFALKVKVQILATLTISVDGYIRLWNNKYTLLFSLKIPSLLKVTWNMKEVEDIKNKKSIEELLDIFKEHYDEILEEHPTPAQVCSKSKKIKYRQDPPKINHREPIKIEIENKDIEELVMQKQDYKLLSKEKYRTQGFFHTTSKIYPHPWRRKKQFVQLYDRASPLNKYNQKMPQNLLEMRTSLDMRQKPKILPDYKQAELLLPQLTMYQPERQWSERQNPQKTVENQQQGQNFQSCLYVKSQKKKKKINEFDQIDKEFKKKEMMLTARKWVPKKRKDKNKSVAEIKSEVIGYDSSGKIDPIKAIHKIFEEHNRECMDSKKGRMIRIPKISINRDLYL